MPQKADALPAHEIALIERWIKEGAINDAGPPDRPLTELVRATFLKPAPEKYARAVPVTALAFSPIGTQIAVSGLLRDHDLGPRFGCRSSGASAASPSGSPRSPGIPRRSFSP